jgi:hypothetical protein
LSELCGIIIFGHKRQHIVLEHSDWVGFLVPLLSHNSPKYSLFSLNDSLISYIYVFVCVVVDGIHHGCWSDVLVGSFRLTK